MYLLTMFWWPVLFAVAMCAPGAKDPHEITHDKIDVGVASVNVHQAILDEIMKWLYKNSGLMVQRGISLDSLYLFLQTMEEYMAYKNLVTTDGAFKADPSAELVDTTVDTETESNEAFIAIFEYIDKNIEDILVELIYTLKNTNEVYVDERDKAIHSKTGLPSGYVREKFHEVEDMMGIIYNLNPAFLQLSRTFKRAPGNSGNLLKFSLTE